MLTIAFLALIDYIFLTWHSTALCKAWEHIEGICLIHAARGNALISHRLSYNISSIEFFVLTYYPIFYQGRKGEDTHNFEWGG